MKRATGQGEPFVIIRNSDPIEKLANSDAQVAVVVDKDGMPVGVINNLKNISEIVNRLSERSRKLIKAASEYDMITKNLEQEIFVTDGEGYILFLNPEAEKVCGVKAERVIGKHVLELKNEKIFSSSCTLKVLQTGKRVNIMKLKNKRLVLGTGVPIYDDAGQLVRILSTSSDVKEINRLMEELTDKRIQLKRKNNQLKLYLADNLHYAIIQ